MVYFLGTDLAWPGVTYPGVIVDKVGQLNKNQVCVLKCVSIFDILECGKII